MKHYITIIRKTEFTDLFKYGYLYINSDTVVEFDGNTKKIEENNEIRNILFSKVNPFDYTFTIVVIHFKSELDIPKTVYIEDVLHIYPLDSDSKRQIEISFDSRIRIESPIWENQVHELQEQFLYESSKKGILNLWHLLDIKQDINEKKSIISDTEIKELVHEAFSSKRPKGDLSFWVYLLRYERHGFYPKTSVGYFYDLINVFINYKSKEEMLPESVENTGIYKFLNSVPVETNTTEILTLLKESSSGQNFIKAVNECATIDADVVNIAILFLIFKNTFSDGFKLNEKTSKIIKHAKDVFSKEFAYAAYLLGIYLGNDHTYECLYDQLPLPIFKDKAELTKTSTNKNPVIGEEDDNNNRPFHEENDENSKDNQKPRIKSNKKAKKVTTKKENLTKREKVEQNPDDSIKSPQKDSLKTYHQEPTLFDNDQTFLEQVKERVFPIYMRKKGCGGRPKKIETEEQYNEYSKKHYYEVTKK